MTTLFPRLQLQLPTQLAQNKLHAPPPPTAISTRGGHAWQLLHAGRESVCVSADVTVFN